MLEAWTQLTAIDYVKIGGVIITFVSAITVLKLGLDKFLSAFGIKPFWDKRKEEEQRYREDVCRQLKLLKKQDEEIEQLQSDYRMRSEKTTKEILDSLTILSEDIRNLGERIEKIEFNKKIKKYRWDINNFATQLSRGVKYGKDQFDIIFQEHDEYKNLLREHHLSNGQTTIAMDVIRKKYKELYFKDK